jgi:hypothetical protein
MMDSSTFQDQPPIILKEYGRNAQNIVNYILTIEDREKRSRLAKTLIELMRQINPAMRDAQDSYHKIWDHLYIMSNFKLDVDCPYPKPEKSILDKKPMRVEYNTHNLFYKHYGKNVELLIKKAVEMADKEEQEAAIIFVGKLMKRFYASWNKENVDDAVIVEHLIKMSKNKLSIELSKVRSQNLFDSVGRDRDSRDSRERETKDYSRSGNGYGSGNSNNRKLRKPDNNNKRKRS